MTMRTSFRFFALLIFSVVIMVSVSSEGVSAGGFGPDPSAPLWHPFFCVGDEVCKVGDFNGDGTDDIVAFERNALRNGGGDPGNVFVALSTGASFQPQSFRQLWNPFFCVGGELCDVGDFDGDGKDDIILFKRDTGEGTARGDVIVALSDGTSFTTPTTWNDFFCIGNEVCDVGDFNGDGKDDIILFKRNTGEGSAQGDVLVALSDGNRFRTPALWHDFFCIGNELCDVGDFDGDGKSDIVLFKGSQSQGTEAGDVIVALSDGTRFDPGTVGTDYAIWHPFFCVGSEVCRVGDFNGDGKDDIAAFVRDATVSGGGGPGNVYVALSTGSSFQPQQFGSQWHDDFCRARDLCETGDFNGDSKDDIITFKRTSDIWPAQGNVSVALSDFPSMPEGPEKAEEFGFGHMRMNGTRAEGFRPLLVILAQVANRPLAHDRAYYESLVFGPRQPNIVEYFYQMSYGKFTWRRAGVIGPISPGQPCGLEQCLGIYKRIAFEQGFNFEVYDVNRDGRVTTDELGILVIDNATQVLGATRVTDPPCVRPANSAVDICSEASAVGEAPPVALVTHELAHLLGTLDVYGEDCLSGGATLMSCTSGSHDDPSTFHMDPWHKMALGWIRPRIYRLTNSGACTSLAAAQVWGRVVADQGSPIILYQPSLGTNKYFMLEFRNAQSITGSDYDAGVPSQGVAMWYIETDDNKDLRSIPGFLPRGEDKADFLVGAPDGRRGQRGFWTNSNGQVGLKLALDNWLDTSDYGLRFQVGLFPLRSTGVDVEWNYFGGQLRPYIQTMDTPSAVPGSLITLNGVFGVTKGDRVVSLEMADHIQDADVKSWTCSKVVLRIPDDTPPGNYQLRIFDNSSRIAGSNSVSLNVRPGTASHQPITSINFRSGQPGSFFVLTGWNYPANTRYTVSVNDRQMGAVTTDNDGFFGVAVGTSHAAMPGLYRVAIANPLASAQTPAEYILDLSTPLRLPEGGHQDALFVQADILPPGYTNSVFLPWLRR